MRATGVLLIATVLWGGALYRNYIKREGGGGHTNIIMIVHTWFHPFPLSPPHLFLRLKRTENMEVPKSPDSRKNMSGFLIF